MLLVGGFDEVREKLNAVTKRTIENNEKIHHVGYIKEPVPYYAAMDVFVMPSRREGFGLTNIEAGAMKLPVITSRVTGCVDGVVDNVTGLMIDVDNEVQLENAMLKLVKSPDLRRRLAYEGHKRTHKLFDSERLVAEHMALYERVLGSRKPN